MSQEYLNWLHYLKQTSVNDFTIKKYSFHFSLLVRGRKCDTTDLDEAIKKFQTLSDIQAPKKKYIKVQGRCNLKKQPRLYLSSSTISIPLEIGLIEGELFCVGHFVSKSTQEYGPYSVVGHEYLKVNPKLKSIISNYLSNFTSRQAKYDSTLGRIMTTKRREVGFDIYALTNAITTMIFQKRKAYQEFGWNSYERIIAMIYPCVHFAFNAFNIVMDTKVADEIFDVKTLYIFEFQGYTTNGELKLSELAQGTVNQINRNIHWNKNSERKRILIVF